MKKNVEIWKQRVSGYNIKLVWGEKCLYTGRTSLRKKVIRRKRMNK